MNVRLGDPIDREIVSTASRGGRKIPWSRLIFSLLRREARRRSEGDHRGESIKSMQACKLPARRESFTRMTYRFDRRRRTR